MTEVTREELHFRRIDIRGYRRSDGLYEVEGRVTDSKPQDFVPPRGRRKLLPAHEPLHAMGVRLVFDDQLFVHDVHTSTDAAPHDICHGGGSALKAIKGLRMSHGWSRQVRSRLGGGRSCTHLMELLIPMATVAFQCLPEPDRSRPERTDLTGRPLKIDSCYAYGAQRELVLRYWPEYHRTSPNDEG